MTGHFSDQRAEIRLVIDGDVGEFGIGRGHLHECLKRLAGEEPNLAANSTSDELDTAIERIFNEQDDSHLFFITANGAESLLPDVVHRLNIVGF